MGWRVRLRPDLDLIQKGENPNDRGGKNIVDTFLQRSMSDETVITASWASSDGDGSELTT